MKEILVPEIGPQIFNNNQQLLIVKVTKKKKKKKKVKGVNAKKKK